MSTCHTIESNKPGSRYYWGPRLWRLFHLLAEHTHKPEAVDLWKILLHKTALIMPCEKCRLHLREYLATHKLSHMRTELWKIHNSVNEHNGLPQFAQEQLTIYAQSREQTLLEIKSIFDDIKASWTPLYHVMRYSSVYEEWKTYMRCLIYSI